MNKKLLSDPEAATSCVWFEVAKAIGPNLDDFEPDTIRLELKRYGIEPTDFLMAKIMSAQTAHAHPDVICCDHDAFFAFAIAEDGIPSDSNSFHFPTVDQLCWAVLELNRIAPKPLTDDEGFDSDEVDPAISCILLNEGFVLAPNELSFVQDSLDRISFAPPQLKAEVSEEWSKLSGKDEAGLRAALASEAEDDVRVQLTKLADARIFVLRKEHGNSTDRRRT